MPQFIVQAEAGKGEAVGRVRARQHADPGAVRGARLLEAYFGPAVTEPVRLHVAAKRYLSALDAGYADTLAPAARHTLTLQGGSFTGDECRAFDRQPGSADALALRRFDDRAVVPGVQTPVLAHYRPLLESLLQR